MYRSGLKPYLKFVQRFLWGERIEETDNIFMVDEFHELELAISSFGVRHILKGAGEFFDGAILPADSVVRRTHDALK